MSTRDQNGVAGVSLELSRVATPRRDGSSGAAYSAAGNNAVEEEEEADGRAADSSGNHYAEEEKGALEVEFGEECGDETAALTAGLDASTLGETLGDARRRGGGSGFGFVGRWGGARVQTAAYTVGFIPLGFMVRRRRCKLDPGLKATGFKV